MSSSSGNGGSPLSVFISYASADRPAARALSQTLAQAGLDVWLDEEELAGGEAWDAKIRRQIRNCTYFMPVISATTEARREGYFRREWRLAVERTLDLADDVTFLVPVVIDDTSEQSARVPEKFTSVQWLRCPGGQETPALVALARRLATEHGTSPVPVPTAPLVRPPPPAPARPQKPSPAQLRPFPEFPAFPAAGHRLRFIYDLVVWSGHMILALWARLPRWLRFVAMVVIVFKIIGWFSPPDHDESESKNQTALVQSPADVGKIFSQVDRNVRPESIQKFLAIASGALDAVQGGRPLALVTFDTSEPAVKEPAERAFAALHRGLSQGAKDDQIAVGLAPLPAAAGDAAVYDRAALLKCRWLLVGAARPDAPGAFTLEVKLYDVTARKLLWQTTQTRPTTEADALGEWLVAQVREHVSLEPPPAP